MAADFSSPELCIETLCRRATSVAQLTNFSFEFFYQIFTKDACLFLLYHDAKKSKMTKNSNQVGGGSCLKTSPSFVPSRSLLSVCSFQLLFQLWSFDHETKRKAARLR